MLFLEVIQNIQNCTKNYPTYQSIRNPKKKNKKLMSETSHLLHILCQTTVLLAQGCDGIHEELKFENLSFGE